ncbi:MAG TPA: flap endonuclease, partial [Gemmatimonadota bacterium]|nr:flap endonuclease [Gemmatimonadota bacterium]
MKVHLVDGTYELFRHYYALPSHVNGDGQEVAATRGVVRSLLSMVRDGATHVAVATDHVVESVRNQLWPDYKDGSGIEPELFSQFGMLEDAL